MNKYKDVVYMILDELKIQSDDSIFTEDHIIYLINKVRPLLLENKYKKAQDISDSNYQTICLDLELVENKGICCSTTLRSKNKIPAVLGTGSIDIDAEGNNILITYISKDRMPFVGYNKYMQNIIYATRDTDKHLYFKSNNPQHKYLNKVTMTAVFEDSSEAAKLSCAEETECDILDMMFPLEDSLIMSLIDTVMRVLLGAAYRPRDNNNNASDDLSDLVSFIRRNVKSDLQKQIER